jgi:type I restriction enzyme S subunit
MQLTVNSKQLPVGWQIKKLRDICEIEKNQGIYNNLPYVGMENIESNTAKYIGSYQPQTVKSSTFRFSPHHILYGRLRPYLNKVLAPNFEGHCSTEIFPIKPSECLNKKFFLYWLLMDSTVNNINKTCTGARMPRANMTAVFEFDFLVPPLPEQKRIVAILDEAFEGIDRAISNTEKNLSNARELFESYLNSIFSQKGEGWVEKTLGDVCDFLNGFAFKSTDTVNSSDVQLIRMGNLYQNILDLERKPVFYPNEFRELYAKYIISEGDLIMSLTGTVDKEDYGYTVEVPKTKKTLLLNQRIVKFINIDSSYLDRKFFLHLLRTKSFLNALYNSSRGVRQANLSSLSMKGIQISLPPVEIQKFLVSEFRALETETQQLENIYRQKIAALKELKQSILQKAFTGELTTDKGVTVMEETAA